MRTVDLCFIWAVGVERKRCSAASVDIGQLIEIKISRERERERALVRDRWVTYTDIGFMRVVDINC